MRIEQFESSWIPRRKFPAHLLMGADKCLAAMLYQLLVSRLFEHLDLAAIVATRLFSAVRGSNPYKTDQSKRKVEVDQGNDDTPGLAYAREHFKITSEWMLVDALEAVKWALIFTGWTNETGADTFSEWFNDRLRLANGNFGYIAALFHAVAVMVALHMRGGLTFDNAFAATRAEAEWLKAVADKALEEHPKTAQPQKTKRSRTPVRRGKRSRSPLRRRRGEGGAKARGKGGKQDRGTKPVL